MLVGFRQATTDRVREPAPSYDAEAQRHAEFLFDHERLNVYQQALAFVRWCHKQEHRQCATRSLISTLDISSTGMVLNIAEGNGKFSKKDRCRFIEQARTAALRAAANLDVVTARKPEFESGIEDGKTLLTSAVRMLVAWHQSLSAE
jgi:four helix bundle protein